MNTVECKVRDLKVRLSEAGERMIRFQTYGEWIHRVMKL